MSFLTLILAALCAFMGGYILGISDIFRKAGAKTQKEPKIHTDEEFDEEYRNFLNYDGSEQI